MLVLARKKNETIVINEEIVVQVLQIKGKTIRLGISAPNDVRIARGELKPLSSDEGLSIVIEQQDEKDAQQSPTEQQSVTSTTGLKRFIKSANQVGETSPNTAYNGAMPTTHRLEKSNGNRFKVLTGADQSSLEVQEAATSYQVTCEVELPMTEMRSNQN